MSNDVDLTRKYSGGRVLILDHGHGSSSPARVIMARHTFSRKILRNRRQAALLVGSKVAMACESRRSSEVRSESHPGHLASLMGKPCSAMGRARRPGLLS
jgi:hypothetical protein